MEFSGPLGVVYRLSEWVYKLVFLNLIWLLFNLPIIFLGINLLITKDFQVMLTLITLIAFMLPFLFFPSTFALFRVTKHIMNKEDVSLLYGMIKSVKEKYMQQLKIGWICTIFWVVLLIDIIYMIKLREEWAVILFLCIAFFASMYQLFLFTNAIETTTIKKIFFQTMVKIFRNLLAAILIVLLVAIFIYVSTKTYPILFFLIIGTFVSFTTNFFQQENKDKRSSKS